MTDERFERDLTAFLRDVAGPEAPLSLRARLAAIADQPPAPRPRWFAAPVGPSLAAAVVVIAVAVILVNQPWQVGPLPSASPGTPGPGLTTAPTLVPSASPGPSPSGPTPTATPSTTSGPVGGWTGLRWSAGVPGLTTAAGTVYVRDVLPWRNGYVGVGYEVLHDASAEGDTGVAAAFLTSTDALHWTIAQLGEPSTLEYEGEVQQVVAIGDGLIAIGPTPYPSQTAPLLWRSDDGRAWTLVDSPSWRAAWGTDTATHSYVKAVVGGPHGIVAIGGSQSDWGEPVSAPVIAYSSDGLTWDRLALSAAFNDAYLRDVVASVGGFVIVGRTGAPDSPDIPGVLGGGRPAAWTSTDGRTWSEASIPGARGAGDGLIDVVAGSNGLFAVGRRAAAPSAVLATPPSDGWTSGWASSDGQTWRFVGDLGRELPDVVRLAGDGAEMVLFGRESCKANTLTAWSSTDAGTWTRLAFSGSTSIPSTDGPICRDDGTVDYPEFGLTMSFAKAVPGGVVVTGSSGSGLIGQLSWFATATGP